MQKERRSEQKRAPTRTQRHHMSEQRIGHKAQRSSRERHNDDINSDHADETLVNSADIKMVSPFSSTLRSILHHNRSEISRIAREMDIAENTIYRWMNGTSVPRNSYLRALPDVMLEHRQAIIQATNQTFPGILNMAVLTTVPEIRIEIYRRVHELIATTADPANCLWQVAQTIFDYAILHLDIEHTGISISYASLMPPSEEDGSIHSLYEAMTRGTSPWPSLSETRIFLGSTTLAGAAVTQQRMMRWDKLNGTGRIVVEMDEHEASSCAAPVMRGGRVAGVFAVSSTQPHFFDDPTSCRAISDLAHLLAISLQDKDFYPYTKLKLRPMLNLTEQREVLAACYVSRLLAYARENRVSRAEAEIHVRRELERQFEQH